VATILGLFEPDEEEEEVNSYRKIQQVATVYQHLLFLFI
jgi:hypothetical protein